MRRQSKTKKFILRPFLATLFVFVIFVLAFVVGNTVYAYSKFYGKEQACLSSSGGRSAFQSVQYACGMATCRTSATPGACRAAGGQNACTGWLGPVGNSTTRVIRLNVPSVNSIAQVQIFGMCTDRSDRTSAVAIAGDNGSIAPKTFTRPGTWGSPSGPITTLDVARFIVGASVTTNADGTKTYFRQVGIGRTHSDNPSANGEPAWIYITVGKEDPKPEPQLSLCQAWMPTSYPASNADWGLTSIVVKARNTESRFNGNFSGLWHHENLDGNNPAGETGPIYAKQGDKIQWHSCYYPGIQATAKTDVSDINNIPVNGGANGTWSYEPFKTLVGEDECMGYYPTVGYKWLYKAWNEFFGTWENFYKVGTDLSYGNLIQGGDYGAGEYAWRADFEKGGEYIVDRGNLSDVGKILEQNGDTGTPKKAEISSETPQHTVYAWQEHYNYTCDPTGANKRANPAYVDPHNCRDPRGPFWEPYDCPGDNHFANAIKSAKMDDGNAKDQARVIVPYNFVNDTSIGVAPDDVFSGEHITVEYADVTIGPKYNNLTLDNYATVVPEMTVKLFMYVTTDPYNGGMIASEASCDLLDPKQCLEVKEVTMREKYPEDSPISVDGFAGEYDAFDASAGDYICFVTAVTPWSSGADDAIDGSVGDGMWKFSESACKIIMKKPTFQVWGSSLYSKGNVVGSVSKKWHLYNEYYYGDSPTNLCKSYCFDPEKKSGFTNFVSWSEESLNISGGITKTVASGAATGYKTLSDKTKAGYNKDGICDVSPLTLSNVNCKTKLSSASVGNSGIPPGVTDRDALIKYWVGDDPKIKRGCGRKWNGSCEVVESATGETIYHITGGGMNVSGGIGKGETYLVQSNGTVTITGNLTYPKSGYELLKSIPKVIIYAKDINVSCGVNEIDAILITREGGTFNTCSNAEAGNDSDPTRLNQLKIFGVVMTDKIVLGRTYGAAAWDGRTIGGELKTSDAEAAEVFDYDSTIPMWSEYMSGSAETDTLQITYQHELAPRY